MPILRQSDTFNAPITSLLRPTLIILIHLPLVCILPAYWFFLYWKFLQVVFRPLFGKNNKQFVRMKSNTFNRCVVMNVVAVWYITFLDMLKTSALSFKNDIFCCCVQHRRNQQRNKQKTRKFASDMKKPKNVNVLTKRTKINALESLRLLVKWERLQHCFSFFLGRTGRSFVKCLLRQYSFRFFRFFRC